MAGPKSNVIEYIFQGDTLNLQEAIKKVTSLLAASMKELKKFQDGTLNAEQKEQVKQIRERLKALRKAAKQESQLSETQRKAILEAGNEALKQTVKLSTETAKIKTKAAKNAAEEQIRLEKLTSVVGREGAIQEAAYLERYADKFKHTLTAEAYDDIKRSVAIFNEAVKDTTLSQEEMAGVIETLQSKYKDYRAILHTVNRSQQQAARSLLTFGDMMQEVRRQVVVSVKSFSFWLQVAKKVFQIVRQALKDYLDLIQSLSKQGLLKGEQTAAILEAAQAWQDLTEQVKLFLSNVAGTLVRVLAPLVKFLSFVLMIINSILEAFSGLSALMSAAKSSAEAIGGGLAGFDALNVLGKQEGDEKIQNLISGYEDLEKTMKPVLDLFKQLGQLLNPIFDLLMLPTDVLLGTFQAFLPLLDALIVPIEWMLKGLTWLLTNILTPVIEVIKTITSNIWLLITALTSAIGLFMVIKGISLADVLFKLAMGFWKVVSSIWGAVAAMKKWIVEQVKNIAMGVKAQIGAWLTAKAYWKVAIAAIAAAGALAAVVAGIILTATAAAKRKADQEQGSVPAMAKGGVVKRPTLSLIGEGSYSEAVIPLGNSPQFKTMKEDIAEQINSKVGSTETGTLDNAIIKVFFGQREYTAFTYDIVNSEHKRRTGLSLEKVTAITRR